jgi:hypothetical protein
MDLLRDIWDSIDPQSNIGCQSETLTVAARNVTAINAVIER